MAASLINPLVDSLSKSVNKEELYIELVVNNKTLHKLENTSNAF